jgi:imidazolonepropionase-like amidohydrolase
LLPADILVVNGDPTVNIADIRKVLWVMKDGMIYKPD